MCKFSFMKQALVVGISARFVMDSLSTFLYKTRMNKSTILQMLLAKMEEELRRQLNANEQAMAGATDSESRAETKWDTCGLEASYLARGHALQFKKLASEVQELRRCTALPDFTGRPVGAGALITVESEGETMRFLLMHYGGGTELELDGCELTVITQESPVGAALLDKKEGDSYSFRDGVVGKILRVE